VRKFSRELLLLPEIARSYVTKRFMDLVKWIAAFIPIVVLVVGAATAYLRLFVRNELNELVKTIRGEFVSKEMFETKAEETERRVSKLEGVPARSR